ncbi:type II secretion system protein GspK [Alteromonas flava]|uniref:type II secretion system protein GspK n=1 Tax=Alteromonas flava TaxID=2048003 RepID=UPI000C29194C|nr:type II secretion system protein GspK [Alteromonas flava]
MIQSSTRQQGFILVASIWVMAILIMMVSAFAVWVEKSLDKALLQNHRANMEIHTTSTQSTLLYLIATQGATQAGIKVPIEQSNGELTDVTLDDFLGGAVIDDMGSKVVTIEGSELYVDGSSYKGVGNSRFSLLDLSGLIPLNSSSPIFTEELLSHLALEPARIRQLTMTLQDYIDKDNEMNANGAELFQYQQRGLPAPPNGQLLSRFELKNIIGWSELETLWGNSVLHNSMVASTIDRYNVNAMSPFIAQVVFDLSPTEANVLVTEGKRKKYSHFKDMVDRTGLALHPYFDRVEFNPSSRFRLSFWYPEARLKRELDVYFPVVVRAGDLPWVISRDLIVPVTESEALVEPREPQTHLLR